MILALAGGVGGAKLADGLAALLGASSASSSIPAMISSISGLAISPDLDTVMYTLAGIANPETGWGVAGESWTFLDQAVRLGGPGWFRLGDRDLGDPCAALRAAPARRAADRDHRRSLPPSRDRSAAPADVAMRRCAPSSQTA